MDEYIKRSDALKVIETANSMASSFLEATMKLCVTMDRISAADVAPVVRCGECKHRHDDNFCGGRGWPEQLVPDDGYCDCGARREGDGNK